MIVGCLTALAGATGGLVQDTPPLDAIDAAILAILVALSTWGIWTAACAAHRSAAEA